MKKKLKQLLIGWIMVSLAMAPAGFTAAPVLADDEISAEAGNGYEAGTEMKETRTDEAEAGSGAVTTEAEAGSGAVTTEAEAGSGAVLAEGETAAPASTPEPTPEPTETVTPTPTPVPTADPTVEPTPEPSPEPTADPTVDPTPEPSSEPTPEPTPEPSPEPTPEPAVTGPKKTVTDQGTFLVYSDGSHYTGWYTFKSGRKVYCDPGKNGAFVTGLKKIGKKNYLFSGKGFLRTKQGVVSCNGKRYLLNGKGVVKTGWYKLNGKYKMYFSPEKLAAVTGFQTIREKTYYFDSKGRVKTAAGLRTIDGSKYYSRANGSLRSGWVTVSGSRKMYFDPKTFKAKKGLQKIGSRYYLFKDNFCLFSKAGTSLYKGAKYWVAKNGSLKSGWLKWKNMRLYFDPKTFKAYVNTKKTIDGIRYSFNSDGVAFVLTEGAVKVKKYAKELIRQTGGDLYKLYRWAVDNIAYVHQDVPVTPPQGYTREEYYFTFAYENHIGNCFNYASVFYWTAKELGMDVRLVQGRVGMRSGGTGPHGWVEVRQNGTTYVCDPDAEYEARRGGVDYNGYMQTYASARFTYYPNMAAY